MYSNDSKNLYIFRDIEVRKISKLCWKTNIIFRVPLHRRTEILVYIDYIDIRGNNLIIFATDKHIKKKSSVAPVSVYYGSLYLYVSINAHMPALFTSDDGSKRLKRIMCWLYYKVKFAVRYNFWFCDGASNIFYCYSNCA